MKADTPQHLLQRADGAAAPLALVIGSGFGGLAAAVRLACKGWRVQVLEKLDAPGGRAYVHRIDGYTFDAGPTLVTVPQLFDELFALAGRRFSDAVQMTSLDPFYRIRFDDGSHFDYCGDLQRMRAEVARFSPADVAGYEAFLVEAERCYQLGFNELGSVAFEGMGDLLAAVPSLIKMRAWRTIHQLVCKYIKHPQLRIVFSFHPLLIGGNPSAVTCTYSLINTLEKRFGVHWATGGTGQLVRALVDLLAELQVPVRCNAEVKRILVRDGRACGVELANGEQINADIVVSNGDVATTYRQLVPREHRRRVWTDAKLDRARYSMSLFVWYFGLDRRHEHVPHHTMVLGPRYEGLLKDIFKRHHLADDFSLYLHRPTATDPSMAPPGCDTFYVLSPVPHLDSGTDWTTMGEVYRKAIERRLEETMLPGLSQQIRVSKLMTPLDFRDRLLSFKGAAFGLEPRLLQSAWFRPHNRSEDLPGLYMVGAGTHPGAGIPGVLMSAKALESVLPPIGNRADQRLGSGLPNAVLAAGATP
ncbi:MAG: phytoene desaturase [Rubrivivax sp.]|jgi:phytoene desaturase|nr:phytoene desaturase [Rubrivivax sp.]